MPTPAFFEARAPQVWPYRWTLGISAFAVFVVLYGVAYAITELGLPLPVPVALLFGAPFGAMCWLWGLMLVGVWFHPKRGTIRIGSPWFLGAPRFAQVFFRWYAALLLALWFLVPLFLCVALAVDEAAA